MTTVLESLNAGLLRAFENDPAVVLIGEDVLDPYGGAFKVTRGLSSRFPGRVFSSPISEAGITGLAAGMALRGLRPVVEIMFGDFLTLTADQLINHAAKFRGMYNGQVQAPLIVRTPMGGRRGYGPTHSQTLEKHFLGVPGLTVLAVNALGDPGALLEEAILNGRDPLLFIENKTLYPVRLFDREVNRDFDLAETAPGVYKLGVTGAPPAALTLATYGQMAEVGRAAIQRLAYEHEVFCEMIVFTRLSPFDVAPLQAPLRGTGALVTLEEGTISLGWGAEILARCIETDGIRLRAAGRIAAQEIPIPSSGKMENAALPDVEDVVRKVLKITGQILPHR